LGAQVVRQLISDIDLDPEDISEVILGQVLQGGAGQNPARQTALKAGVPVSTPALTINQVCGAGQRSIHLATQAILAGDADVVIAGGQDSMTEAPFVLRGVRAGYRVGERTAEDLMLTDGLRDAFHGVHMGVTVENLARRYQITRDEQDSFALNSQAKAKRAIEAGVFRAEIAPVRVSRKDGDAVVAQDEHPLPEASLASLARLKPVFDPDGTITAGNSSGLNDGAAAVVVCSEAAVRRHGFHPLARVVSYASGGVAPMDMGLGPVVASKKALAKANWTHESPDLLEINEAFAAQAIAVDREMGWDCARINVNGGAIALGHPLAGSGCRIVVTLLHEMARRQARKGLASLCIGGGQGVAICLER